MPDYIALNDTNKLSVFSLNSESPIFFFFFGLVEYKSIVSNVSNFTGKCVQINCVTCVVFHSHWTCSKKKNCTIFQ